MVSNQPGGAEVEQQFGGSDLSQQFGGIVNQVPYGGVGMPQVHVGTSGGRFPAIEERANKTKAEIEQEAREDLSSAIIEALRYYRRTTGNTPLSSDLVKGMVDAAYAVVDAENRLT